MLLTHPSPASSWGWGCDLSVSSDFSQVSLPAIVRLMENLALGMGRLGPYIKANRAVISRTLITHFEKITGHPSCITCLRPRQMCDCRVTTTYDQLRTLPPVFTTLTSTVPHQVSSQVSGLHSMGMPSLGSPMTTAWSSTGSTSLATGWTPPRQPVFPSPMLGKQQLLHRTDNQCYIFSEHGWHASSETESSHYSVTAASMTGYSLHPFAGSSKDSLCPRSQYLHRYFIILFRHDKGHYLRRHTVTRQIHQEATNIHHFWIYKTAGSTQKRSLQQSAEMRSGTISHHW